MPSPFPGMDPYLEMPDVWPDFHDRLATMISADLNAALPSPYYARLEMRLTVQTEPIRHHYVEIRDSAHGHRLVTLIEIVNPSNKGPGPDRRAYEAKQQEVLHSDANLIELDLLRAGDHLLPYGGLSEAVAQLGCDYLIVLNRSSGRHAPPVQSSTVKGPRESGWPATVPCPQDIREITILPLAACRLASGPIRSPHHEERQRNEHGIWVESCGGGRCNVRHRLGRLRQGTVWDR